MSKPRIPRPTGPLAESLLAVKAGLEAIKNRDHTEARKQIEKVKEVLPQ